MTSVIMPVWIPQGDAETLEVTASALASLGDNIQKIIIDNGCISGSGWLRQSADTYLRFSENKGYTVAINRGIVLADGDLLALANNDIRISPNWPDIAREILADPTIATLHPKMVDYDSPFDLGTTVTKEGDERHCGNSFTITTKRFLEDMRHKETNEPFPGLFDENYGIGGGADDWDFAWRIHKLGYKRCFTDRIAFQHKHSFSLQKLGVERQKIADQNNAYFEIKWGKPKEALFREAGLI